MSDETDAFVAQAGTLDILDGAMRTSKGSAIAALRGRTERTGPCPVCGGTDRFGINLAKQVFLCRQSGAAGGVINLVRYLDGVDFKTACEILVGRDWPAPADDGEREERRAAREAARRAAEAEQTRAAERTAKRESDTNAFRRREWDRCLDDWRAAGPFAESPAAAYLDARGAAPPEGVFVRCHPDLAYWHGRGSSARILHRGPAMLVLFMRPCEFGWQPIGLHRTWIDLEAPPKYRPLLADPESAEALQTKKMRGTKSGGLLPLIGRFSTATRMVGGEGIETTLAYAWHVDGNGDGPRADTFYFAAGDLGNLAGKALDRVRHPTRSKLDRKGRRRPVFVPGKTPDPASSAIPVPEQVRELVLLGDGDSDPTFTRTAMLRAAARHHRADRRVLIHIAPSGTDWGDAAAEDAA
ncbi:DNA primase [Aurantimonas sp. A2-1-M11]|uniref:DUF7146 domain-containing protein n=1 Tax=Aurantimonas sp. A2-1-M11 TaxID=3113712 RepID=UPI002F9552ED